MRIIRIFLFAGGLLLLALALYSKFFGRPPIAMGVRIISLVTLANTAFILLVLTRMFEKK
jgi:hypothetical protein